MPAHRFPRPERGPLAHILLGACLLIILNSGCASVSVQPQRFAGTSPDPAVPAQRPRRILVEAFTFPEPAAVRVDRQGAELIAFQRDLQTRLSEALVRELGELGLDAVPVEAGQSSRREPAWVVTGQFTRLNQGSRGLRIVIGLGAGGTKMETAVQVFDLASVRRAPVTAFRTTGGSNAEPGLIGAGGPITGPVGIAVTAVSAAATVAGSGAHGVTEDARRTARMIAAYLSEDLARRGYLDPSKVRRAKRLGGEVNPAN